MPYISMEYVDGEDLASLLQRIGRLPADKALEIARKICAGVAAAHDKGVIHRDLKPANIMLDRRGNVVIMDFGLAAVADQLRGAEARSGTPAYMAPEQLRGEEVTAQSDIYALGMVLYEIFTGKRAYEAASMAELIRMQESAPDHQHVVHRGRDRSGRREGHSPLPRSRSRQAPAHALSVAAALPGGDPLAAALAAGETPSPELVAASGKTEGLPLKKSVPLGPGTRRPHYRRAFRAQQRRDAQPGAVRAFAGCAGGQGSRIRRGIRLYRACPPTGNTTCIGIGTPSPMPASTSRPWTRPAAGFKRNRRCASAIARVRCRWSRCPMARSPQSGPRQLISGMIEAWVEQQRRSAVFHAVPPQVDRAAPGATGRSADHLPCHRLRHLPVAGNRAPVYARSTRSTGKGLEREASRAAHGCHGASRRLARKD